MASMRAIFKTKLTVAKLPASSISSFGSGLLKFEKNIEKEGWREVLGAVCLYLCQFELIDIPREKRGNMGKEISIVIFVYDLAGFLPVSDCLYEIRFIEFLHNFVSGPLYGL